MTANRAKLGFDVCGHIGEARTDGSRLGVELWAREKREQVARRSAERGDRGAMDEPMVPVEVVGRVRDDEVGSSVTDDRVESPHELVHRDILDAGALIVKNDDLCRELASTGDGLCVALFSITRDRDNYHRDIRPLRCQASEQSTRTNFEIIGVRADREHRAASRSKDSVHTHLRSRAGWPRSNSKSALRSPQLRSRSKKPR